MRFDLNYIDSDGTKKTPVVLHRAIFGSIDRFMAFYLEETKGILPLWLAPVGVMIMPVNSEYQTDYAEEVYKWLKEHHIRTELDARNEKLGYRMREAQMRRIPYTLILGDNEKNDHMISYRVYGKNETITVTWDEFMNLLESDIRDKKLLN